MSNKHHYFFAIKLQDDVKSFLNEWVQQRKREFSFARWVHPEDYHITLAFLGYAEEQKLQKAMDALNSILPEDLSFSLTLNKIGTFGPAKQPRIFWADVEQSESLLQLQKLVYQQCIDLGFELDKKPFRPHITLARKWIGEDSFEKEQLTSIKTNDGEVLSFYVNEVVLYETHLDKTPKYKEFARFHLASPGA